jgi:hypothetical protein
MLGAMHRRTVWLQGLVENLLCAATIRTAGLQLQCDALSIMSVLADAEAVVEPLLSQRGQRVRVHGAAGSPEVMADRRRLGHAQGTREVLTGTASAELCAGDVFAIETPGGGGWGPQNGTKYGNT